MPSVVSNDPCTICGVHESVMHSHHTIPQSRGGKDSLQIILCSSCHNILHANAVYVVSQIKNPSKKKPAKSFWKTFEEEAAARPWLEILVRALIEGTNQEVEHLISLKVPHEYWEDFKTLARDLGASQTDALLYCIKYTLAKKGTKHDLQTTTSELWFLPVSGSRKEF